MKSKIVHILCEGPTEQGFVDEVLKPYLIDKGVSSVKSIIIATNIKNNTSGGMFSYKQVKDHLNIISKSNNDGEYVKHVFTTMFDYYGLPTSFPSYNQSLSIKDKYERISFLEEAFANDINEKRLIPYIQMHEFEALVFCGLDFLPSLYADCDRRIKVLYEALENTGNPELINNNPNTAPSKRIIKAIEGDKAKPFFHYNKPKTGKFITAKVGIDELRGKCPHFNKWIEDILNY